LGLDETRFTYRSARSGGLLLGIILVFASEGVGLFLWIYRKNPIIAVLFALMNVVTILWLVRDYRALGEGFLTLTKESIECTIGRRFAFVLPLAAIDQIKISHWRDVPEPGMLAGADYINLMKQATPNILMHLRAPFTIPMPMKRTREVSRIAMHLDEPESFMSAINANLVS
jgi:hypothetical protein